MPLENVFQSTVRAWENRTRRPNLLHKVKARCLIWLAIKVTTVYLALRKRTFNFQTCSLRYKVKGASRLEFELWWERLSGNV